MCIHTHTHIYIYIFGFILPWNNINYGFGLNNVQVTLQKKNNVQVTNNYYISKFPDFKQL